MKGGNIGCHVARSPISNGLTGAPPRPQSSWYPKRSGHTFWSTDAGSGRLSNGFLMTWSDLWVSRLMDVQRKRVLVVLPAPSIMGILVRTSRMSSKDAPGGTPLITTTLNPLADDLTEQPVLTWKGINSIAGKGHICLGSWMGFAAMILPGMPVSHSCSFEQFLLLPAPQGRPVSVVNGLFSSSTLLLLFPFCDLWCNYHHPTYTKLLKRSIWRKIKMEWIRRKIGLL